ncbi:hypothetical protein TH66_11190 [Carbonactinospora thermoautotrophica]|uniref:Gram-positive cocci surface proteins LPxTG domain-containing protein n=1 Tax=Carbonactinospora thermoautotrophica TaxID=1469144 RepID=A0A132NIF6_9ACTN|nr:hypothetical protein [Carbonactinospora thermoautotrophica]KWX03463.1 hypothetical protein TH66_11190 [Carbonactinospora thermoautotrophica]KWX09854.1 hypothetical protein TR74_07140 [Carbonactinospora thermoautotrophica]
MAWRSTAPRVLGAVLVAGGVALTSPGVAYATKPDSQPTERAKGTVKIHEVGTPVEDRRNEPHVCQFYLDAFGFDPGQAVEWEIVGHAPTKDLQGTSGTLVLGPDGNAHTDTIRLPDGHYKLNWKVVGDNGNGKHKVFWVECEADEPNPGASDEPEKPGKPNEPAQPAPPAGEKSPNNPGGSTDDEPGNPKDTPTPTAPVADGTTNQGGLGKTGFTGGLLALGGAGVLAAGAAALFAVRRMKHPN